MAKKFGGSLSIGRTTWYNFERNGMVKTEKYNDRPQMTSKRHDGKQKAKYYEYRNRTRKEIKNKWIETEVSVC